MASMNAEKKVETNMKEAARTDLEEAMKSASEELVMTAVEEAKGDAKPGRRLKRIWDYVSKYIRLLGS